MTTVNVGDLVKRMDPVGTGTGIIYRVLEIGEERLHDVKRQNPTNGYLMRVSERTRKVKLQPVLVMFEAKDVDFRSNVTHFECQLAPVDLITLGVEFNKLNLFIQAEAKRLSGEG